MTALATSLLLFAAGCQVRPAGWLDAITPESVSVGVTAGNLVSGPISNAARSPGHPVREPDHDPLGVVGVTVSANYRLKPLRIEHSEPQPVRVVPALPVRDLAHPIPTPALPTDARQ